MTDTLHTEPDQEHAICRACGHYRFLHRSTFQGDCDACDHLPIDERCTHFEEASAA